MQSANFQAEYGRSSGASITLITRSGSKDFRGSAAFYKRDAALNGNEYLRQATVRAGRSADVRSRRYTGSTTSRGRWAARCSCPSTAFNRQRNRLFFFWSQEVLAQDRSRDAEPAAHADGARTARGFLADARQRRPTDLHPRSASCGELQRQRPGGPGCFAGNIIPANRIDPTGQALLNLFPAAERDRPVGRNQYNYTYQMVTDWPRNDQVLRVDWNAGPRTTVYGRLQFGYENRDGARQPRSDSLGGWPQMASKFETEAVSYVTTLLHTINPTTFLEATAGVNWGYQWASPFNQAALDANNRAKRASRPAAVLSGGQPAGPAAECDVHRRHSDGRQRVIGLFQYERRFPFYGYNTLWNFSGSVTKVLQARTTSRPASSSSMRTRPVQQRSAYNGTFSFNTDGRTRSTRTSGSPTRCWAR